MLFGSTKHPKKIRLAITLAILLVLSTVTLLFLNYRHRLDDAATLIRSGPEGADLSLNEIHQTATRDGKKQWQLDATKAHYLTAEKQVVLKELSVTFFTDDQRPIFLSADNGVLMTETKDILVNGNIELKSEDGRLVTDALEYQHAAQTLLANQPVTIFGDSFQLAAQSMVLDLSRNRAVFKGNVKGTFGEDLAL